MEDRVVGRGVMVVPVVVVVCVVCVDMDTDIRNLSFLAGLMVGNRHRYGAFLSYV